MTSDNPLSDREQVLIEYALLLGLTGENSPQVKNLIDTYGNDPNLWAAFVSVDVQYRIFKGHLAQ